MNRLKDLIIKDQGFVFDPNTGDSFTVNPTAEHILYQLQSGRDSDEAAGSLAESFAVTPAAARRDVDDFRLKLRGLGLC